MFDDQYWRVSRATRRHVSLAGPSSRAVRRHARRHGEPTLTDLLAYRRAHRLGRRCLRGAGVRRWSLRLRMCLVLVLLAAGMLVGALFT